MLKWGKRNLLLISSINLVFSSQEMQDSHRPNNTSRFLLCLKKRFSCMYDIIKAWFDRFFYSMWYLKKVIFYIDLSSPRGLKQVLWKRFCIMAWKWCMAWSRDGPFFPRVNWGFGLSFAWCMKGEKVKKKDNK